jgi:DNA-binding MarR family transcriptional regulator
MSTPNPWLNLGLDALPEPQAQRIRLLRMLLVTSTQLRGKLDRELAPSGITSQQAAMLQLIEAQAESPTMSFVARTMGMTHQNVKQIALVLQRKGFVEIVVDPADRRARRLQLTPHHHRFWQQRNPSDFSSVDAWTGGLTDAEVGTAVRLLLKLKKHLNAMSPGDA